MNHSVYSTWAASSTSALLMGMLVDEIVAKVGWLNITTFVKVYMRPLAKFNNSYRKLLDPEGTTPTTRRLPHEATAMMTTFKVKQNDPTSPGKKVKKVTQGKHSSQPGKNTRAFKSQWTTNKRLKIIPDMVKTKTQTFVNSHRPHYHVTAVKAVKRAISKLNEKLMNKSPDEVTTDGTKTQDNKSTSEQVKEKLKNTILLCVTPLPGDLCNLSMENIMNTSFMQEHFSDHDFDELVSTYIPEGAT